MDQIVVGIMFTSGAMERWNMGEYTERVSTNVSPELKQRIRIEAAKRGMTMAEYVREVLRDELPEGDEGNPTAVRQTAN
jgi:hypothetical protein